jgi:cysteine dioxygenase
MNKTQSLSEKLEECFGCLSEPSIGQLKKAVDTFGVEIEKLIPYLENPEDRPYGRKLLYKSEALEVLVMNWAQNQPSAPHDHGSSFGWVKIVSGYSLNMLYQPNKNGVPVCAKTFVQQPGSIFFAPQGEIHAMQNLNLFSEPLISLHFYAPPISQMKVYDLVELKGGVVSDDCGAWWDKEKLLKEFEIITSTDFQYSGLYLSFK